MRGVDGQDLEARGGLPEDMRVLLALWNIFNAFAEPREELLEAAADQAAASASGSTPLANGAIESNTSKCRAFLLPSLCYTLPKPVRLCASGKAVICVSIA